MLSNSAPSSLTCGSSWFTSDVVEVDAELGDEEFGDDVDETPLIDDGAVSDTVAVVVVVVADEVDFKDFLSCLLNLIISLRVNPFEKQHFKFLEVQAEHGLNCK